MQYAKPTDDAALAATVVVASAEDTDYVAENLVAENPSKPAKLTTTSGTFDITLPSSQTIVAAVLLYHNLDAALGVSIKADGGSFSQAITIPTARADGWSKNASATFSHASADWQLAITGTNSQAVSIGRLMLLTSLRTFDRDIRFGNVTFDELESYRTIEQQTDLGVETIYQLEGPRRTLSAEMGASNTQAVDIQDLVRVCGGRYRPFLMISTHANGTDPMIVRFVEGVGKRTYLINNYNSFEWRVQECSRGLPWP